MGGTIEIKYREIVGGKMILSVSRRTDIPSFYSEWFINRVEEGYVYVPNPFNRKQVSKVTINPQVIDCIVFWSKDPSAMLDKLHKIKEYKYYFQFTLNCYAEDVEKNTRRKSDIINTFKELSNRIGSNKVIWRYDPILLNDHYNKNYHYYWFERLCRELKGHTRKCVISFIDLYSKTEMNTRNLNLLDITKEDMYEISERLVTIGKDYNISVEACSENIDLLAVGVKKSKCIDEELIEEIIGCKINCIKDDTQRTECGCIKSIDIGQYNTCRHNCLYCYANSNVKNVEENTLFYDVKSPMLIGDLRGDEKVTEREMRSQKISKENVK